MLQSRLRVTGGNLTMAFKGIFIITLFLIGWDVPKLIDGKRWREPAVYAALLSIGVGSGSALALGMKLPNPIKLIQFFYHPVAALVDKILS